MVLITILHLSFIKSFSFRPKSVFVKISIIKVKGKKANLNVRQQVNLNIYKKKKL